MRCVSHSCMYAIEAAFLGLLLATSASPEAICVAAGIALHFTGAPSSHLMYAIDVSGDELITRSLKWLNFRLLTLACAVTTAVAITTQLFVGAIVLTAITLTSVHCMIATSSRRLATQPKEIKDDAHRHADRAVQNAAL